METARLLFKTSPLLRHYNNIQAICSVRAIACTCLLLLTATSLKAFASQPDTLRFSCVTETETIKVKIINLSKHHHDLTLSTIKNNRIKSTLTENANVNLEFSIGQFPISITYSYLDVKRRMTIDEKCIPSRHKL